MPDHYDVVVIGGGSAGAGAAARLSADPARGVLLLEAGPDPRPIPEIVADPGLQRKLLFESDYVVMYPTTRDLDGSSFQSLAGRIMGGGSSVNVTSAPRPTRNDLDTWAALGNPEWAYERSLPFLKRMEADQDFPDSPLHGSDGPIYIKRPFTLDMPTEGAVAAFIARSLDLGLPICDDMNCPEPFGICASPYNVKAGRRQSTTVAYLDPARARPNLTILAEAPVVSLDLAGRTVQRVVFQQAGQSRSVSADQVVLSAGVYHTPQILMLSGIGPTAELERLDIPVRHPLEGVGENYQDHAVVYLTFEGATEFNVDFIVPRFRLIVKSDPALASGNFHIMMRPPTLISGLKPMLPISLHLLEQRNRGRVTLQSLDPSDLPTIEARMLEHPHDIEAMTWAMRYAVDLVDHPLLAEYYGPLLQPGPRDDWADFARSTFDSYHHGVGTCQMGPASNALAVVDQTLRVHGLDNLWIADASVFPTVPHANTNLTAILIGERLADFIQQAAL